MKVRKNYIFHNKRQEGKNPKEIKLSSQRCNNLFSFSFMYT